MSYLFYEETADKIIFLNKIELHQSNTESADN